MFYPSPIPAEELSARRAITGWWYRSNYRASLQGYRSRGQGDDGWAIRISRPRRRYAFSHAPRGSRARKVHMVRDQIVATRGTAEYRLTRYRCGAHSWHGYLLRDAETVCLQCAVVASGEHMVRIAS